VPEQRRLVTVVFADVVGSTALAEELDAEDVRALFTRYYALANEVVASHGGIVAKLLGDGVLACFGVPTSHGDDAQRALDAALALRERVSRDEALQRLKLRIGVNTGEVLATEDGTGEIVGDAVNVAARVAAAASEGEVLAADATHRSAPQVGYGDAREIAAKGKSQPVRVWPVAGGRSERAAATPFIAREDDLAQLELVAKRAFSSRRPFVVTITAPPGTGKSRLMREFRMRLPDVARYAHAHCPPYGATLGYGPLREIVLDLVGVSAEAPPDEVRRQIGAVLDGADAEQDARLIALTIAPEGTAEEERDLVFLAWRRLVTRVATEKPFVLVIEDAQNASDTLLDLVDFVTQPSVDAPMVVLCLARPELLERRPTWGGGRRNSLSLTLEPLGDDAIAMLVASMLEVDPPAELKELVIDRAAGNPFFAEELVRALLDHGPLDLDAPGSVAKALKGLPETVQATVLARIDMLPAAERGVLQAGAVVGRAFDLGSVRALVDSSDGDLDATLDRLVERDLLTPTSAGNFAFRNALVRDVAYGMLPRARRARDHAVVARRLEETAGERSDELASVIGLHYLEATKLRRSSAVPLDIPGVDAEATRAGAVRWLARAAHANTQGGAWAEAIMQIEDAVALAASDDERMRLLFLLGETQYGGDVGWNSLTEALRLWRASASPDPVLGARILTTMLLVATRSGVSVTPELLPDEAAQVGLADEAIALARQAGDPLLVATALVPRALLERGRAGRTKESLQRARDEMAGAAGLLYRESDLSVWSIALDAWAALAADLGDLAGGREIATRRVEQAERLSGVERAHALWTMPIYELAMGDPAGAERYVTRALHEPSFSGMVRSGGHMFTGLLFILSLRCGALWARGAWDEALRDVRAAIDVARKMGDVPMRAVFDHAGATGLYIARRRRDDDLVAELSPLVRGWVNDERAVALLQDDLMGLDDVLSRVATAGIDTWHVERTLSLFAAYGRVPSHAERLDELIADADRRGVRPLLAQLLRLRARRSSVAADARRAHELLAACGMEADAALAGVEMAALGDPVALDPARAVLERIGDVRGLEAARALG
jgi:class 3 adenylate cyclase